MKKPVERKEITRVEASPEKGLTSEQVRERVESGYANLPVNPSSKSVGSIIAENVFTYFNLIFTILAVILIMVGQWKDLSFMPIISHASRFAVNVLPTPGAPCRMTFFLR